ncbi:hypothetical protein [Streptomyces anulatus]|uniref:hypothetical protein n=1 Tax=Streptomyces anulatus TaxID=1892 RepID=UPI00341718CE
MIGKSRPGGRHRDGQTHTPVYRRLWDGPAQAGAERLDRAWPDWTVLYSLGNRRFYAVAAWPTPQPVIVEDETAEGLESQMREAETARNTRPAAPVASSGVPPSPSSSSGGRREAVSLSPGGRGGAGSPMPAVPRHSSFPRS